MLSWLGSFSAWHVRHLKSSHSPTRRLVSYSVVQLVRCLKGQPLASGKREAMVMMAAAPMHDSAILPCFHGCLAFLHKYFSPQSPPHPHPLGLSLYNQWQPSPWDCSTIPMLQLPAAAPSRGPVSLSGVCMAMARTVCMILIPFILSQISSFTLSLKCFFSVSNNCLDEGIGPLLQFPHLPRAGRVLLTLLFSPLLPSSYYVLRDSIHSFLVGQVLLSALSWCSSSSVSEGVFLMYLWREMYSTSTYSSAILFSTTHFIYPFNS